MKTVLIIAGILLVVGALLVGAGWVLLQKYPTEMNTVKDSVYEYHVSELPTQINITTIDSRVEIRPTEGDVWKVTCVDKEKLYHTVDLTDGILTVKQIDKRQWYEHIGILGSFQNLSVIVYLPEQVYENLAIHSTSGSIKVKEGFTFSNASLQNTSGSISCASRVAGALNVQNTSGSIRISGSVGGDLTAKNTSGSINVSGGVNGKLDVRNGSGSVEITNASPASASIKNTSGGIDLINVVCGETCEIINVSGSIELDHCDAASFDLKTTSGGIRGSVLTDKIFDCHSTSGSVHTPGNGNGGTFKARTTSGGIKITIAIAE